MKLYKTISNVNLTQGAIEEIVSGIFIIFNKAFMYFLNNKDLSNKNENSNNSNNSINSKDNKDDSKQNNYQVLLEDIVKNNTDVFRIAFMLLKKIAEKDSEQDIDDAEEKIILQISIIAFLVNCSPYKLLDNVFNNDKFIYLIPCLLKLEQNMFNKNVNFPIEVEKVRSGCSVEVLKIVISKGDNQLECYNFVFLRLLIHIADVIENRSFKVYDVIINDNDIEDNEASIVNNTENENNNKNDKENTNNNENNDKNENNDNFQNLEIIISSLKDEIKQREIERLNFEMLSFEQQDIITSKLYEQVANEKSVIKERLKYITQLNNKIELPENQKTQKKKSFKQSLKYISLSRQEVIKQQESMLDTLSELLDFIECKNTSNYYAGKNWSDKIDPIFDKEFNINNEIGSNLLNNNNNNYGNNNGNNAFTPKTPKDFNFIFTNNTYQSCFTNDFKNLDNNEKFNESEYMNELSEMFNKINKHLIIDGNNNINSNVKSNKISINNNNDSHNILLEENIINNLNSYDELSLMDRLIINLKNQTPSFLSINKSINVTNSSEKNNNNKQKDKKITKKDEDETEIQKHYDYIKEDFLYSKKYLNNPLRNKADEAVHNSFLRSAIISTLLRIIKALLKSNSSKIQIKTLSLLKRNNNIVKLARIADSTKLNKDFNIAKKFLFVIKKFFLCNNTKNTLNTITTISTIDNNYFLNQINVISILLMKIFRVSFKNKNEIDVYLLLDLIDSLNLIIKEIFNLDFSTKIKIKMIFTQMIKIDVIKEMNQLIMKNMSDLYKEIMNKTNNNTNNITNTNVNVFSFQKNIKQLMLRNLYISEVNNSIKLMNLASLVLSDYFFICFEDKYEIIEIFYNDYLFENVKLRKSFLKQTHELSLLTEKFFEFKKIVKNGFKNNTVSNKNNNYRFNYYFSNAYNEISYLFNIGILYYKNYSSDSMKHIPSEFCYTIVMSKLELVIYYNTSEYSDQLSISNEIHSKIDFSKKPIVLVYSEVKEVLCLTRNIVFVYSGDKVIGLIGLRICFLDRLVEFIASNNKHTTVDYAFESLTDIKSSYIMCSFDDNSIINNILNVFKPTCVDNIDQLKFASFDVKEKKISLFKLKKHIEYESVISNNINANINNNESINKSTIGQLIKNENSIFPWISRSCFSKFNENDFFINYAEYDYSMLIKVSCVGDYGVNVHLSNNDILKFNFFDDSNLIRFVAYILYKTNASFDDSNVYDENEEDY